MEMRGAMSTAGPVVVHIKQCTYGGGVKRASGKKDEIQKVLSLIVFNS